MHSLTSSGQALGHARRDLRVQELDTLQSKIGLRRNNTPVKQRLQKCCGSNVPRMSDELVPAKQYKGAGVCGRLVVVIQETVESGVERRRESKSANTPARRWDIGTACPAPHPDRVSGALSRVRCLKTLHVSPFRKLWPHPAVPTRPAGSFSTGCRGLDACFPRTGPLAVCQTLGDRVRVACPVRRAVMHVASD